MKSLILFGLSFAAFGGQQQDQVQVHPGDSLVTQTTVAPLTHTALLTLTDSQAIHLEPGVRMNRSESAYILSTFDGSKVEINVGSDLITLPSPATVRLCAAGWDFGNGKTYSVSSVIAKRRQQDDADTNLKSMQESARKLKNKQEQKKAQNARVRWTYAENPFPTAELFNTQAIQQLTHLSPAGF